MHGTYLGEKQNAYRILGRKSEGNSLLEYQSADRKITIKGVLKNLAGKMWTWIGLFL
jgi:hypothetical protein